LAEILALSKKTVDLKILEMTESPRPAGEVILASAVPKGERFRWLVEKAVELGVDRLIPIITLRSVVKPGEGKREKMEQAVIEACKQCRRNRLLAITEPQPWAMFLEEHLSQRDYSVALLAHPGGAELRGVFPSTFPDRVILIVGPEGGFTDEEVSQAGASGAILVGLGPNILRIETAAMALAGFTALHRPTN
jgi:16S rRNA (uracil1498-N3)-methyltransferase